MIHEVQSLHFPRKNTVKYIILGTVLFVIIFVIVMVIVGIKENANMIKNHEKIKQNCELIRHEEGKWIYGEDLIYIPSQSCYICKNGIEECITD